MHITLICIPIRKEMMMNQTGSLLDAILDSNVYYSYNSKRINYLSVAEKQIDVDDKILILQDLIKNNILKKNVPHRRGLFTCDPKEANIYYLYKSNRKDVPSWFKKKYLLTS